MEPVLLRSREVDVFMEQQSIMHAVGFEGLGSHRALSIVLAPSQLMTGAGLSAAAASRMTRIAVL